MKITNQGLKALTVPEEQKEIEVVEIKESLFSAPNHDPNCKADHLLLRYAFSMSVPDQGRIPFWHVLSAGRSFHSTLSMMGLHDWGLIRKGTAR